MLVQRKLHNKEVRCDITGCRRREAPPTEEQKVHTCKHLRLLRKHQEMTSVKHVMP